jgi:ATP-dependent helicase/nuclease subunit B
VVVDYKRTRDKRLDVGRVYHGLSLQLLGYLLALAEQGATLAGRPIVPVGAFYVSLLRKYVAVNHPDEVTEDKPRRDEALPRGIFDAGRINVLDATTPPTGRSRFFSFFRRTDGTLGNVDSVDAAETEDFTALLAHTRKKLGELADGVLDGTVDVSPYRIGDFSPCQWCTMRAVCRFEFGDPGMRHLEKMKRSDVFARLREGEGDG